MELAHERTFCDGEWPSHHGAMTKSLCQRTVQQALGSGTTFHAFNWSGANSFRARLKAEARLVEYIRALRARHPDSRIHLLAHSHGGNIAFYAARDPAVARILDSIICLSTPFLHVLPRRVDRDIGQKLALIVAFAPILFLSAGRVDNHSIGRGK